MGLQRFSLHYINENYFQNAMAETHSAAYNFQNISYRRTSAISLYEINNLLTHTISTFIIQY